MKDEIYVESDTNEGTYYKVTKQVVYNCTCKGFLYKGRCKHIKELI